MSQETVEQRLKSIHTRELEQATTAHCEKSILNNLPQDMPAPTIANISAKAFFDTPGHRLSFRQSYGDTWKGSDILAQLEAFGFKPLPATLCQWAQWRRHAEPGAQDDMPDKRRGDDLTDSEPICPIWLECNQWTGSEARAHYQDKSGRIVLVTVPGPTKAIIFAERNEFRGGWNYKPGSAKLKFPDKWHSIEDLTDTVVANVSAHTRAYVDTEQGISGSIYFTPLTEQDKFPLTPSQMLRILETA